VKIAHECVLPRGAVHAWFARLNCDDAFRFASLLSSDEISRAERFRFAPDRNRFVATRGLLRLLLSRYADCKPELLKFAYTAYGKPWLTVPENSSRISFNVSHSSDLALFGITRERRIGVDVEAISHAIEGEKLAARFFNAAELSAIRSASDSCAEFYRYWVAKEAYTKAVGRGLSIPLHEFQVDRSAEKVIVPDGLVEESNAISWSVCELSAPAGYVAALSVEGPCSALSCGHVNPSLDITV